MGGGERDDAVDASPQGAVAESGVRTEAMADDDDQLRALTAQRLDLALDLSHGVLERGVVDALFRPGQRGRRNEVTLALKGCDQLADVAGWRSSLAMHQQHAELIVSRPSAAAGERRDEDEENRRAAHVLRFSLRQGTPKARRAPS